MSRDSFDQWCRRGESNFQPTDYDGIFAVFGYVPKEGFSGRFVPRDVGSPYAFCFFAFQGVSAIRGQLARIWREKFLAKAFSSESGELSLS